MNFTGERKRSRMITYRMLWWVSNDSNTQFTTFANGIQIK